MTDRKHATRKFYIADIDITIGEYEVSSTFMFATSGNPERHVDHVASTFYGQPDDDDDKESNVYYFNGGEIAIQSGRFSEITAECFEALKLKVVQL